MKGLLIGAVMLVGCVLLTRWKPPAESTARLFRDYGILLLGSTLVFIGLSEGLKLVGLGEYAIGESLPYIVLGLGYAVGSATKAPIFWNVHSSWPFWSFLSPGWRQIVGVGVGLLLLTGGLARSRQERTAYRTCRSWYAAAAASADSADVALRVPDPHLRPSRGRFDKNDPPPITCAYLYR